MSNARSDQYDITPQEMEQERGLRVLGQLVRRRAITILIPLIAVPIAAVAFSVQQPKEYTADSALLFNDSPDGSAGSTLASQDPARESASTIRLLQSDTIANRVKDKLAGTEAGKGEVTVVGEGEANLVTIEATASTPAAAARLSNAFSREFIAFRTETLLDDIRADRRRIASRLAEMSPAARGRAEAKTLKRLIRQLDIRRTTVSADVSQVKRAVPPTSASAPKPIRNGVIGLIVGLLIGMAIAIARDRLDLRIRDPRHFESTFRTPVIGKIPRSRALRKAHPMATLPPIEGQAFRDLRANLNFTMPRNGHGRSVVVTSASSGEGKTTVAWNLACAAAGPNARVLVIEADIRRPALSERLGSRTGPGLTELLKGQASLAQAIRQVPVPSAQNGHAKPPTVDVMFAGLGAMDPTALFESKFMHDLLEHLVATYDLVVMDTPPVSVASDAVPLLKQAGGVIVVGRLAKSRQNAVLELSRQLERLQAEPVGVVVNGSDIPRDMYRYYYGRAGHLRED